MLLSTSIKLKLDLTSIWDALDGNKSKLTQNEILYKDKVDTASIFIFL